MNGVINASFEPVIKIGILIDGKVKAYKSVIDTGFNGFISVPSEIIKGTSWQFVGY